MWLLNFNNIKQKENIQILCKKGERIFALLILLNPHYLQHSKSLSI